MAIRIEPEFMAAEVDGAVVAIARWSGHPATDAKGAWIASTHANRLFTRDRAISAMVRASLRASEHAYDDPQLISLRMKLT